MEKNTIQLGTCPIKKIGLYAIADYQICFLNRIGSEQLIKIAHIMASYGMINVGDIYGQAQVWKNE